MDRKKEIVKEIKKLRRLKLKCRAGSVERIKLHRAIKNLKNKLTSNDKPDPLKDPIIEAILKIEPDFIKLGIELRKFTAEQLQKHLSRIKEKGVKNG